MSGHRARLAARSYIALSVLVFALAHPGISQAPDSTRSVSGCDQNFGSNTPVLLVHGFHEPPTGPSGVWTSGTPSMEDAITQIPGVKVVTPFDYYSTANSATNWVASPAIGAALASDILCLAHASSINGGSGKVIIVAHSMGGLAVRCAVDAACVNRENTGTSWPAASVSQIALVVTLGTPNLGSTLAQKTVPLFDSALCEEISACSQFAAQMAGNSAAAAALQQGSPELNPVYPQPDANMLKPLPTSIPLYALAGKITLSTSLFGSSPFDIPITDIGDIAVPVNSALAEAPPSTARSGSVSGSTTVNCGTIPIDSLNIFGAVNGSLHTGIPYLTCWHLTETTDPTWQADVITAIRAETAALTLTACTSTGLTHGLIEANPQLNSYSWKLTSSACRDGWAVAQVYAPTVGYGTAFLRQTPSGWSSAALGEVNCSAIPGPLASPLPPHALAVSLLDQAGICGNIPTPTPRATPTASITPTVSVTPTPQVTPTSTAGTVKTITVSSTVGWQSTNILLKDREKFTVKYVSGTWTVDYRNFPYVGPGGYSSQEDAKIYQDCKYDGINNYGVLYGIVGDGRGFSIGEDGNFTAVAPSHYVNGGANVGYLYLRINDTCLTDNAGSVTMQISTP
jgi:pimeloyl-ACP methyl ester carboxylesterase